MNEQHPTHLDSQVNEADVNNLTASQLIDGWAEAETIGDQSKAGMYQAALETHINNAVADGYITEADKNAHVDAIHEVLDSKIGQKKSEKHDDEPKRDDFEGAYSNLGTYDPNLSRKDEKGNKVKGGFKGGHTYFKDENGKSRQVSRSVAEARANAANIEHGVEVGDEKNLVDELSEALRSASMRKVSKEKFSEIADAYWETARRQAKATGNQEHMLAAKDTIEKNGKYLETAQNPVDSVRWEPPIAKDKVTDTLEPVVDASDNAPTALEDKYLNDIKSDLESAAQAWARAKASNNDKDIKAAEALIDALFVEGKTQGVITDDNSPFFARHFKQFLTQAKADVGNEPTSWPAPDAATRQTPVEATPRLSTKDKLELLGSDFGKSESNRLQAQAEFLDLIDKMVEAQRNGNIDEAAAIEDEIKSLLKASADYQNLSNDEKQAVLNEIAADVAVKLEGTPVATVTEPTKIKVNRLKVAYGKLFTKPFVNGISREQNGEPMSRRQKIAIGIGVAAAAIGAGVLVYKLGIDTGGSPKVSSETDKEQLAQMLGGVGKNGQTAEQAQAINQLNEAIAGRTDVILNTAGDLPWNKATSLYEGEAGERLIKAVDTLKAQGIDADWTDNPYTNPNNAAIIINGNTDTNYVWDQLAEVLARQDAENYFNSTKTS